MNFIADKEGNPIGIQSHIDRRVGNSNGDPQMLQWTSEQRSTLLPLRPPHRKRTE
jgi:hypothetical protein